MKKIDHSNFAPGHHKIKVLLIDDQAMLAKEVRQALIGEEDIEFHFCQDPTRAIQFAAEINATVILQDLIMHRIDGLAMVHQFRANKATSQIPIIVLSTHDEAIFKREAFLLGANDYLIKLPDKIELIARIRYHSQAYINLLEKNEAFLALEKSRAQLAKANRALHKLSCIDSLTGITNRRIYDETLKKEWNRAIRSEKSLGLIMIDIDHFKLYNDHYGHQKGDSCLQKVAQGLNLSSHRETDILARYGGEEFSVVLPNTDLSGALKIAEKMRQAVKTLNIEHAKSNVCNILTISLGVSAVIPQMGTKPLILLAAADQALYKAKEDGRDRIKSGPVKTDSK